MTDEELIARLRSDHPDYLTTAAADRIEALLKERDQWIEHTKNAVWSPDYPDTLWQEDRILAALKGN